MTTTMMSRHCTLEWYLARPANPLSTRSAELTSCQLNNRPAISLTSENTKGGEPRFNTRFDGASSPSSWSACKFRRFRGGRALIRASPSDCGWKSSTVLSLYIYMDGSLDNIVLDFDGWLFANSLLIFLSVSVARGT